MTTYRRERLWQVAGRTESTPAAREAVLRVMREHGRPMSLSLITSRTHGFSAAQVAAALMHLIEWDEGVGVNDAELFDLEGVPG